MEVDPDVSTVIKDFNDNGKPIGLCCISPILVSKVLGKSKGVSVTVGNDNNNDNKWPYCGTAHDIDLMGGKHIVKGPSQAYIDKVNKICTSPAYMYDGEPIDIFESVEAMCDGTLSLI